MTSKATGGVQRGLRVFVACGALSVVGVVNAQVDDGGKPKATTLEEIVVTAQKRTERLQDVPIAVNAVSPETMANNSIDTTADLQFVVPSLVYGNLGGFNLPYLRGVGSAVLVPNADATVATYIDGAFISNNQALIQNLLGVERIEVLAGPQGTLYGRNAVGGAINVVTLTPSEQTEAEASLTSGNYGNKEVAMRVSGPVAEDLAVGVYLAGAERDTYKSKRVYFPYDDHREPDKESNWGLRLKAVYTPTDWLALTGSVEKTNSDSFETESFRNASPNGLGYVLFPDIPFVNEEYVTQQAFPSYHNVTQTAATLREEIGLGWADLLGITAYRKMDTISANDIGASGGPVIFTASDGTISEHWSQELQLLSRPGSSIEWITGIYYFHEHGGFFPAITGSPILFGDAFYAGNIHQRVNIESFAVYAQATVPLGERFRLTVGGRYTKDKKSIPQGRQTFTDINDNEVLPRVTAAADDESWNEFTPKLVLDYKVNDTLWYLSYGEGFKSGAYNISTLAQRDPVDPEYLKAYELGVKSQLWDGRMIWNNAAYFYDYSDIQVNTVGVGSGGNLLLLNAAEAELYGIESSLTVAAAEGLELTASVSYAHTEFTDFPAYPGMDPDTLAPVLAPATGNELPQAPELVFTLGVDYEKPLAGGTLNASANWYHNDGFYWSPQNSIAQEPYSIVNATLGYDFPGNRWSISLWGRNLTDDYYSNSQLAAAPFGTLLQDGAPRMYGVSATFRLE